MEAFDQEWKLIKTYGVGKLALVLGRTTQTVWRWRRERRIPARLLSRIEELTGARKEALAPELFDKFTRVQK